MDSENKDYKIIVVEDDEDMRDLIRKVLSKKDYKVEEAPDGESALKLLEKNQDADLVIADIHMPGISGIDLLREIKKKYPLKKVILITSFGIKDQYVSAIKEGAFEFLCKPFSNRRLLDVVARAFRT